MIEIFAHRGLWKKDSDQNSLAAIEEAFKLDFHVETDIRDLNGALVISHDPATVNDLIYFKNMLEIKKQYPNLLIALNIKSDGLSNMLIEEGLGESVDEFLLFDGSFPTMRSLKRHHFRCLDRLSEFESSSELKFDGLWVDSFESDWLIGTEEIFGLASEHKIVIFVSPELHQRGNLKMWDWLRDNQHKFKTKIGLCTDYPIEARKYFE